MVTFTSITLGCWAHFWMKFFMCCTKCDHKLIMGLRSGDGRSWEHFLSIMQLIFPSFLGSIFQIIVLDPQFMKTFAQVALDYFNVLVCIHNFINYGQFSYSCTNGSQNHDMAFTSFYCWCHILWVKFFVWLPLNKFLTIWAKELKMDLLN